METPSGVLKPITILGSCEMWVIHIGVWSRRRAADCIRRDALLEQELSQVLGVFPEARFDLEHDPVENDRETDSLDLTLAEPVVKDVIKVSDADARACRAHAD